MTSEPYKNLTVDELKHMAPDTKVLYWLGYIKQEALTPGQNSAITTKAYWGMIEDIAREQRRGGEDA